MVFELIQSLPFIDLVFLNWNLFLRFSPYFHWPWSLSVICDNKFLLPSYLGLPAGLLLLLLAMACLCPACFCRRCWWSKRSENRYIWRGTIVNKVTTRWEGPQSLSYHKQSLSKDSSIHSYHHDSKIAQHTHMTLFDSYCHDGMSVMSYLCSMTACGMISFGGLLSE